MTQPIRLPNGRFASTGKGRVHRKKVVAAALKPHTNFAICYDASGSMSSILPAAQEAYDRQVAEITEGIKKNGQTATITLITFGESGNDLGRGEVRTKYVGVTPSFQPPVALVAQSGTPLLDAVGEAVMTLKGFPQGSNVGNVVMVITDGHENESRKYTRTSLKALIGEMTATDKWTFAFSVPFGNKQQIVSLGLPVGNIQEWEATKAGTYNMSQAASVGTQSYFSTRATGATKSTGFFVSDASKLTPKKVAKACEDVAHKVAVWSVPGEVDIRTFVETKGYSYGLGRAYYQLTKTEKIQAHKDVILREKGTHKIYAGRDARDLLGLPDFEVKCVPGNHGNWDIFVQSTSTNRKLVRGTQLVYMK